MPWYLALASLISPMRYVIDLIGGVVFSDSSESRLVLATPATNVAVLLLMFASS